VQLNKRNEPIPSNAISLSAAFRKFIEHRFVNLRDLECEAEKSLNSVGTHELVERTADEAARPRWVYGDDYELWVVAHQFRRASRKASIAP
jgi:hypothetical protein